MIQRGNYSTIGTVFYRNKGKIEVNGMRIKKFIAASLQEGKARIIKELGDEAIILSSRIIKKPGDDSRDLIEIVAAIDDNPLVGKNRSLDDPEEPHFFQHDSSHSRGGSQDLLSATGRIFEEFAGLKTMIADLNENMKYRYSGSLSNVYGKLYKELILNELSEEFALKIVGEISSSGTARDFAETVIEARRLATKHITTIPPMKYNGKRNVCAFVGPTGCGKTTTVVKIGILCKLVLEGDVLIVSADTHKVGGNEQLQIFSSIAGIPFRSVYTPDEIEALIRNESTRNFILIDTTGVSPLNKDVILDIVDVLRPAECTHTYMVQSINSSESFFRQSLKEFAAFEPNSIILTKFDEIAKIGGVISALLGSDLPCSYFSTGQKVPDDIEPASVEKLAQLLLSDSFITDTHIFSDSIELENNEY